MRIDEILRGNRYPGRGIIIGKSPGGKAVIVYFIMGRSVNSRNRIFVKTADGLRTEAFAPSKLSDPSLVIYNAVKRSGAITIVTNGDQTDTIAEFLEAGRSFEDALRTRTFEPDPPIYTPRISGILLADGSYKLSILKALNGEENRTLRFFFEFAKPMSGFGHLIHTYREDGTPVPSFEGEPVCTELPDDIETLCGSVWEALDAENKVSLYVSYINLETGKHESRIFNKLSL